MPCEYGAAIRANGRLDARCNRGTSPSLLAQPVIRPGCRRPTAFVGVTRAKKTYHFTSEKRVLT